MPAGIRRARPDRAVVPFNNSCASPPGVSDKRSSSLCVLLLRATSGRWHGPDAQVRGNCRAHSHRRLGSFSPSETLLNLLSPMPAPQAPLN